MDRVIGDWGGTRLRLWRLSRGEVTGHREGPGILAATDHAEVLAMAIGDWRAKRIVLCGMAGVRGAMRETPYVPCPASTARWVSGAVEFDAPSFALRIAAGISRQDRHGMPDVMRGEETQVFGAMTLDPALTHGEHLVVLPGTHSKWVRLKEGRIADFRTS